MISETVLREQLPDALAGVDLPFLGAAEHGKVRDIYRQADQLILVTTDRLSAFDRILGLVPFKGQVLTQLAAFWFAHTADIIPNHLVCLPDPNVTRRPRLHAAAGRGCRARLYHGRHLDCTLVSLQPGRAQHLRYRFPRWPAQKRCAAAAGDHAYHQGA